MKPRAPSTRSTGLPWGGALALAIVLAVECFGLGLHGPWATLAAAFPYGARDVDGGVALDRLALAGLADRTGSEPRVVFMGSSRAERGWDRSLLPDDERPDWQPAALTHPGLRPLQLRLATGEVADASPDVVVLLLSEFDTHRALQLVPRVLGDRLGPLFELVDLIGATTAWEQRATLLRFGLAALLPSYRFRPVIGRAFTDRWRRFEGLGASGAGDADGGDPSWPVAIPGGTPRAASAAELEADLVAIEACMPKVNARGRGVTGQLGSLQSITLGAHADAQQALLESAVAELRAAGSDVLVVEGPLAPLPAPLHDAATRDAFRAFARHLVDAYGAHLLLTDESGPFELEDFGDPVHLDEQGALKLTRATVAAVDRVLQARAARH